MRLIFMGTPDFSVPTLTALAQAGHDIAAVYTQPPRPAGRRGLDPMPSAVQREAERLGFPIRSPVSLKGVDAQAAFAALESDVAVVVAYGLLLPRAVLDAPHLGCFNGHASLLPRWRGAAPIHRAVMSGDLQTGIMVMKMDEGLDTGPVAMTALVDIPFDMTTGDLHERLKEECAVLMVRAMAELEAGTLRLQNQPTDGATYATKIDKAEARIDWTRPAATVHNQIRGLSPFPGAWCQIDAGKGVERLKVLRCKLGTGTGMPATVLDDALTIACGDGAVRLTEVQRAGGKPQSASDFLRGARIIAGTLLR